MEMEVTDYRWGVLDDPDNLCSMLQGVNMQPTHNVLYFNLNPNDKYSINTLCHKIDSIIPLTVGQR